MQFSFEGGPTRCRRSEAPIYPCAVWGGSAMTHTALDRRATSSLLAAHSRHDRRRAPPAPSRTRVSKCLRVGGWVGGREPQGRFGIGCIGLQNGHRDVQYERSTPPQSRSERERSRWVSRSFARCYALQNLAYEHCYVQYVPGCPRKDTHCAACRAPKRPYWPASQGSRPVAVHLVEGVATLEARGHAKSTA